MKYKTSGTANIKDYYCVDCGWPVVFACCNHPFTEFKDASEWDWWVYCSDKGCKNHDGEGIFQNKPDWVGLIDT